MASIPNVTEGGFCGNQVKSPSLYRTGFFQAATCPTSAAFPYRGSMFGARVCRRRSGRPTSPFWVLSQIRHKLLLRSPIVLGVGRVVALAEV